MKRSLVFLFLFIFSAGTSLYAQSNNFDGYTELPVEIDTSNPLNIWEIAMPSKSIFDAAFSTPNALITDSINYYPVNNQSAFQIKIHMYTLWTGYPFFMVLWRQKMDVDLLKDGGVIEVSYDSLQTWTNIFLDTLYQPLPIGNFNVDTLSNGQIGITEMDAVWKEIGFCWSSDYGNPIDEVYIRYTFYSDSIETLQEGWMIDNFNAFPTIVDGLEKQTKEYEIKDLNVFPNPANNSINFNSSSALNANSVEVRNMSGNIVWQENISGYKNGQFNIQQLSTGTYIIILRDKNGKVLTKGKFIKTASPKMGVN